jgi:hypothetical protein
MQVAMLSYRINLPAICYQTVNSLHIMNSIELLTKSLVGWVSRQSGQSTLIDSIKVLT